MKIFWQRIYWYLNTFWGKVIIVMMFPLSYILFYYVITNDYTLYIATTVPVSEVEFRIDSSNYVFIPGEGMFSEEEQFYAYTEQSEESEVSTAGKVMWKTNIISVRKKTSDIHLPFVSCNEDTQDVSINIELEE